MSVARVGDALRDSHVDACVHKQHTRLESLRTFQAGGNRLQEIPLMLPKALTLSPRKKLRDARLKDGNNVSFPLLSFSCFSFPRWDTILRHKGSSLLQMAMGRYATRLYLPVYFG